MRHIALVPHALLGVGKETVPKVEITPRLGSEL